MVQEASDTPLLDIVGLSNANTTTRATFGMIIVEGYMTADAGPGWELSSKSGIIRFNLTEPGGVLDGVTITGAGDTPAAVVVLTGTVRNINVFQSQASGVIDGNGIPVGPAVVGTTGGLSLTGMPVCQPGAAGCPRLFVANSSMLASFEQSEHPLLVGQSGESHGRLAIEADGSIMWGDGSHNFDTVLRRHIARKVDWDPERLEPGKVTTRLVNVSGASAGDATTAGHSSIGLALVMLAANVAQDDQVQVIMRNVGDHDVDITAGTLRVTVAKFA